MHERTAAVWLLLVALGLLLGLLVVVVALGVARHLRRSRRGESPRYSGRSTDRTDDIDHPGRVDRSGADPDREDGS